MIEILAKLSPAGVAVEQAIRGDEGHGGAAGVAEAGSLTLRAQAELHAIAGVFRISRAAFTHSQMVVAHIRQGAHVGRGECEPHESDPAAVQPVIERIEALVDDVARGLSRHDLAGRLPAGPARNALDCALWDFEAKRTGRRAHELAGLAALQPLPTVYTLGIDTPTVMALKAASMPAWRRFKIKLGGGEPELDLERVVAVRRARPDVEIIVDANGGWTVARLAQMSARLAALDVALIEQPLLPGEDAPLAGYDGPVPLCADESCLDRGSLAQVAGRYAYINIKLDKTGGLTEALALAAEAEAAGLGIMVGCMTGTSLAMAPAFLVAQRARFIDLDGPMLLAQDRPHGLRYADGMVHPPTPELWG